jgi:hypothetical protein
LAARFNQVELTAAFELLRQQPLLTLAIKQAHPKLTQSTEMKTGVG